MDIITSNPGKSLAGSVVLAGFIALGAVELIQLFKETADYKASLNNAAHQHLMSTDDVTGLIGVNTQFSLKDAPIDMFVREITQTSNVDGTEICANFVLSSKGETLNVTGGSKYSLADSDRNFCWQPSQSQ